MMEKLYDIMPYLVISISCIIYLRIITIGKGNIHFSYNRLEEHEKEKYNFPKIQTFQRVLIIALLILTCISVATVLSPGFIKKQYLLTFYILELLLELFFNTKLSLTIFFKLK